MPPMEQEHSQRAAFSERNFYLAEFRNRTLAIALPEGGEVGRAGERVLTEVLADLVANSTRVVLLGGESGLVERLSGRPGQASGGDGWVGRLWRRMREHPVLALIPESGETIPAQCTRIALRLGLAGDLFGEETPHD